MRDGVLASVASVMRFKMAYPTHLIGPGLRHSRGGGGVMMTNFA